jgi:hypothetical protein
VIGFVLRGLCGVYAAAGCSTLPTGSAYDAHAQLGQYRTYVWLPLSDRGRTADAVRGSLAEHYIKVEVDRQLAQQGIAPAEPGTRPDFYIDYHMDLRERRDTNPWTFMTGSYMAPYLYTQGTLAIDFVDPATRHVFWRGVATGPIDLPGPPGHQIDEAVAKMILQYPPIAKNVAAAKTR